MLRRRSRRGDSNPQPPVYKTGALPIAPRRRTTAAESAQRHVGLRNRTRSARRPRGRSHRACMQRYLVIGQLPDHVGLNAS
jgi:hypothetical protein